MRGVDGKVPKASVMTSVARVLGIDPAVFPEYREGIAREAVAADPRLRDEIYVRASGG
jgi:hypothetical protein